MYAPIFGTVNGYDGFGDDAICWGSTYDDDGDNADDTSTSMVTELVPMNEWLVNDTSAANFGQFQSCETGTTFQVTTADETVGTVTNVEVFITSNVTFSVDVTVDLASYINIGADEEENDFDLLYESPEELMFWFRILKCQASQIGFCQPFLDSAFWTTYFDPSNVTAEDFYYEPGSVELFFSPDPSNNALYVSRWIAATLTQLNENSTSYSVSFNVKANAVSPNDEGDHAFIGHGTVLIPIGDTLSDDATVYNNTSFRIDMASNIGLFGLKQPPTIIFVETATKVYVGIVIGICSVATLTMLGLIIHYRDHKIMTMAQSGLLGFLCGTGFVQIVLSFLLLPINDVFCRINNLLYIPGTVVPAILVGRLWRVYTTLSAANALGRYVPNHTSTDDADSPITLRRVSLRTEERVMKTLNIIAFARFWSKSTSQSRRGSTLRKTATRKDTLTLIFALSFPQVCVQIVAVAIYDSKSIIEFTSDVKYGHQACSQPPHSWPLYTGAIFVGMTYMLAFYVAWCSRNLPSVFNEKEQVFRSALISGLVSFILLGMVAVFDLADADPNVSSALSVTLIIFISMITISSLVVPKIQRARSGEEVVVTNILRDMTRSRQQARFTMGAADGPQTGTAFFHGANTINGDEAPAVMTLKPDEAIPRVMEEHLYRLNDAILELTKNW